MPQAETPPLNQLGQLLGGTQWTTQQQAALQQMLLRPGGWLQVPPGTLNRIGYIPGGSAFMGVDPAVKPASIAQPPRQTMKELVDESLAEMKEGIRKASRNFWDDIKAAFKKSP